MAETLNTYEGETPENGAHAAEMVSKAEALSQEPEAARPDWLPDKFQSPEAMAQAYRELEQRLSGQEQEQEYEEFDLDFDPSEASHFEAEDYLGEQGLNYDVFADEFMQNGELSDEAYQVLADAGIPQQVVDAYIDGQVAVMQDMQQTAFEAVGGQEEYSRMVQWAQNNLSAGEISSFNAALETADLDQALFAIQGLSARYRSDVGVAPNLLSGQTGGTSAGIYNSVAEVTRDMSDPRYEADPAFRQMVAMRLAQSNVL